MSRNDSDGLSKSIIHFIKLLASTFGSGTIIGSLLFFPFFGLGLGSSHCASYFGTVPSLVISCAAGGCNTY